MCGVVWCYVGDEAAAAARDGAAARRRCPSRCCTASRRCRTRSSRARSTALYPAGDQWYWRADFVKRDPGRGGRAPRSQWGRAMPTLEVDDAPVPDRRRRPRRRARRTRRGATATRSGARCSPASTRTRRTSRRSATGSVGYFEALHPYSAGGAYVNMMMDEGQERVRASYRDNYDRLAQVKARVRPGERVPGQPEHRAGRLVDA